MAKTGESAALTAATVAKLGGLLATAKDLHDRTGALLEEFNALLGGKAAIGDKIKAVEQGFDVAWCARYAPGGSAVYVWQFAKDVPQIKRLLKAMPVDEVVMRAQRYLASEDPFFVRARHPFGLFAQSINRWTPPADAPPFALDAAVADCRHTPACATDQEHTRRKLAEMRA